jgi:hypothetical protein
MPHHPGAPENRAEMFRARRVMRRRRAVARTAAIGEQDQQAPEAVDQGTPPEPGADPVAQLKELAELREQGILTGEEFAAEKKKLLEQ